MNQWAVWFNVISFTLMFAAFGFSFLGYLQDRRPWFRSYLLYFASYAFWLLLATYVYFRVSFVPGEHASLDLVAGLLRVAVSLIIAYSAPLMVAQLSPSGASRVIRVPLLIVPVLILLAAFLALRFTTAASAISGASSILFNGFMLAVAARGLTILRKSVPDPRAASLRAFFRLSMVLYGALICYGLAARLILSSVLSAVSVFAIGAFGLAWSILVIVDQLARAHRGVEDLRSLPAFFVREYRITDREAATVQLLVEGKTTREIGEALFVSHRTVETHTRNIYRKCRVSNKVELIKLIESCRAR